MNPSLAAAINAPISSSPRSPLLCHFLPSLPHRFSKSECLTRRRYRVSFPRNSAASSDQVSVSKQEKNPGVHGNKKELTGLQPIVEKMTPPVRLATSAVVLVVYALNSAVPEVAAISLHNYVAEFEDPAAVTKEDVEKIADRYGVNKGDHV